MEDYIINAIQIEQRQTRPLFSAALHERLRASIDRESRRGPRRTLGTLAACAAAIAFLAASGTVDLAGDRSALVAELGQRTSDARPNAGIEVLLQRSDRAAVELGQRLSWPNFSQHYWYSLSPRSVSDLVIKQLPVGVSESDAEPDA